jgi:integrase
MTKKSGERILGPYKHHSGWQVIEVDAFGGRTSTILPTEAKAQRYKELLAAELSKEDHTTSTALVEYKRHLADKGTQEQSIDVTEWAIAQFFPEPIVMQLLSSKRCAKLYEDLRTRPSKRTKKPLAADTHRNVLAQAKSFLAWCVERGWLRVNPLDDVKGIGKRRPRGKSLGKNGTTLRVKEARAWYVKALALAESGDEGATAALVALLLGMRASEITSRRVADLDEDAAPGDLLWIPCAKTPAGRRTLEVPGVLRAPLVRCAEGKSSERYLFEASYPTSDVATRTLTPGKPHWRDWIIGNVHRICDLAKVPKVTAHAMRGLLATLTAERGVQGHAIAAMLGHEDERTTMTAYAAPGAASAGERRRGLTLMQGGLNTDVQVDAKAAK